MTQRRDLETLGEDTKCETEREDLRETQRETLREYEIERESPR